MNSSQIVLVNPNQMKPVVAPLALDYLSQVNCRSNFQIRRITSRMNFDLQIWKEALVHGINLH